MGTITAPPTLPASWRPTGSGCLSPGDFWMWDYGTSDQRPVVLGGPSQTTDCLPTPWASDVVFSGEHCPQGYTSACQGTDSHSEVTCCPSLYSFTCHYPVLPTKHDIQYPGRCVSHWWSLTTVNVSRTRFDGNPPTEETVEKKASHILGALAVIYTTSKFLEDAVVTPQTPASSLTPASITLPTSTESSAVKSSAESRISAAASAGIGIGAAAGTALLVFVVWYIYRARRSRRKSLGKDAEHLQQFHETAEQMTITGPENATPTRFEMPENPLAPRELPHSEMRQQW